MTADRVILDLCAGTGNWSEPYAEAGYDVRRFDLPDDIRLVEFPGKVHGILAAPPCTVFARSGNRWPRTDDDYREALSVVSACLRFVVVCDPVWWALENPVGKLVRWLGPPSGYFDPFEFGDPYLKRTALWGAFNWPNPTPADGIAEKDPVHYAGPWSNRAAYRSATPRGFARAFFGANP